MSISTPGIGTNSTGQAEQGTTGSSISNDSSTTLSTNEFLDLMMDELQNQDPLDPSSSDPTQYLTELAQMTSVEQETDTAQNTGDTAQAQSVSQAVGLIGDSVTYINQTTGASTTGTVNSVQITNTGPTLTVDGVTGVALSTITNVTAASSAGTSSTSDSSPTDGSTESGS
ncbi:MAG TPA: flagellar hook capping FlgD N-terminal domain-containing protein [Solirubrobacteraceae bacterium]|jgi:flagellar basal-body rod modification protein FlgD|nr:flagellar hook capping FlgD N-terminal domain-containing protein [Solirubrobacteraceae bacterium]